MHEKLYETVRTRDLRERELSESEIKAVSDIETFGCHQIHVSGGPVGQGWAYTLGVYDTCGKPELLAVGLKPATAQHALNRAHEAMLKDIDLTSGRHAEMVGEVDVIFRPVSPAWVEEMMGWTKWYQGDWNFPVLQLIYPDLENRFQWADGFTEYFRQPLLQADAAQTPVEEDFRKSLDPESSFFDWPFPDPPHTSSYLSTTVHTGEEAVTYVSHDDNGDWQFLGYKMIDGGGPVVSCLHHPIDRDPTLKEVADLPLGWYAVRDAVGDTWSRSEHDVPTETA